MNSFPIGQNNDCNFLMQEFGELLSEQRAFNEMFGLV